MNWNGKRVLVTGAAGFIGSHLAETLSRAGAHVRAFIHYNALSTKGWLENSDERFEIIFGDVGDGDSTAQAMEGCDVVFHLAALIGIPYSYVAPREYVRTNVEGTLNVLQAARRLSTPRILVTSTSEVYGTAQYAPIDEKHPLVGQSPYAATKIGADQLAISFHRSFDLPVTIVRPFNTYGPRQSTRAIIPTIITQALRGGTLKLGSLETTRDMNYVADTVCGFIRAAEVKETVGETLNLGSGNEVSIGELAREICKIAGIECRIEVEAERLRPKESEVFRLIADSRRANEIMGWKTTFTLAQGLRETIAWFEANASRYGLGYAV